MCHDEYLKRPHVFNFTPSCTPCDCDDSCVRKSSCCPSKFLRHDADDLTRPSLSCVQPLWNPHPGFNVKSYWLIDNCPNGESCHLPQLQANNISLSTPVTSLLTNESYKNIHCALCHNESTLDLIFWKQNQVLCRKRSDLLLRKTPEELQQFVFREDPRCNVLFYPPRSLEDTIKPCVYVHDVPENLSSLVDADRPYLIQACNKYYVPYTNCHHTFKNVFCALCYQESLFGAIKQMPIECKEDNTDRLDYFKTFSALLDFDKEREVPTLENEICAWDQMYDNRMGKCLDLTCEKEYVLDQNPVDCRPKFFEWGENIYELSMIFKFSRQVDKEAVDNLTPYLMNILKKKVTQNNFSEYLCVIRIFELDDNNEWYFGALIGFAINKKHDIDNMIEKLIRIFEKDDANLHGYDVNISSSILGQRFHLSQNNGHFEFSPCRKYLNPMTLAEIIPSSSLELQSSFLCTEVSSTIVVADWYRCPKKQKSQCQIWNLEDTVDDLEQYGRRNSLRFHNCPVPGEGSDTDKTVIDICKQRLAIELKDDDIFRSHPIGKPNKDGNIQIICRFKNWKIKNKIYLAKRNLKKSGIFITEDLTKYRQGIVKELASAKKAERVHSFCTSDGRIFTKLYDKGHKYLIRCIKDLHDLAPPQWTSSDPEAETSDNQY
ncbi:uncharacterized protein LOC134275172 [Saccostrea cucullata]|uniref:uncharacterized protein LOC134275172 n=1 Tax=Saccostrea cuccullata TaxID=36930 RepID=UPI002ED09750